MTTQPYSSLTKTETFDAKTVFEDIMKIFSSMEETSFDLGIIKGIVGKGKLSLTLPDNILTNIVFGSNKAITFNEDDFLELKDLLLENNSINFYD